MMNDFFADLDADLGLEVKLPKVAVRSPSPVVATIAPIPVVPEIRKSYSEEKIRVPPYAAEKIIPRANSYVKTPPRQDHSGEDQAGTSERASLVFPQTRFQSLPILPVGSTRVMVIGGQNEIGKNMTAFQNGEEILLVDAGMDPSAFTKLGAKCSIPDISFLIPVKNKIVGLVITNGHFDQIGGLKYILPFLGYPKIYATKLTIGLIKRQLQDTDILHKTTFHIVNPDTDGIFQISPLFKIEFFRTIHNIPDSIGVYIETPEAKLMHMGDSKCDIVSSSEKTECLSKMEAMGRRGIDLFLGDSTASMKDGFAKTEKELDKNLRDVISKAPGRVIVATVPSLIGRIQQVMDCAEAMGKTVFLNGQAMIGDLGIARDLGYLKHSPNRVRRLTSKVDTTPDKDQIILTSGSQGEEPSGIHRMAAGEHQSMQIRPGDTVILPSVGREMSELMNNLIRLGAILFTIEGLDIHSTGHANREDQKVFLDTIRPYNLMPAHGELFMRIAHKQTAMALGVPDENIFLVDNGTILDIDKDGRIERDKTRVQLEEVIVDGLGLGIATSHVIDARAQMMQSGVVTLVCKIDEKSRALLGHLKLETRGLVHLDEVREAHKIILKKARASYEDTIKDIPDIEEKDLLKIIRRDMEIFLEQRMGRTPVIIPIFIYV